MIKKIDWLWFVIVMILELFFGFIIFLAYVMASLLLFGEGSNSFLYSNFNGFLWAMSPGLILIFNIFQIFNAKKMKNETMINTYKSVTITFTIIYVLFIVFWGIYHRFSF